MDGLMEREGGKERISYICLYVRTHVILVCYRYKHVTLHDIHVKVKMSCL